MRGVPVEQPVIIRWNAHQVPHIEARSDRDLAVALGLVHGHLRLAQIRLLKQVSQGRLSEMLGPLARDIDHTIRILDFGKAVPEIVMHLPDETRRFMEAFARGLNHYQSTLTRLPPEFGLLALRPEPFTVEDLLTIGRFSGIDINWLTYLSLLPERTNPDWPIIWSRVLGAGLGRTASFETRSQQALNDLAWGTSRSGSNCVVISGEKSASGGTLIASDPHLSLTVPNMWLLLGLRSPSYRAVGFMIPGLPFIALGRNPDLAWGGTSMRAASSDLYDIAKAEDAQVVTRKSRLTTRLWTSTTRTTRTSRFGSVITDSPLMRGGKDEVIALRWAGHLPSDETSVFLRLMRARSAEEIRPALGEFAVGSQNILCVDRAGNICHALAAKIPKRLRERSDTLVLDATNPADDWMGFADARQLPFALNPPEGFLASANDRPAGSEWPIGYFFNGDERVRRLREILSANQRISVDDLKALQQDTVSLAARKIHGGLMALIDADPRHLGTDPTFLSRLRAFDGDYRAEAAGPVAFETLLYHLVPAVYGYESPKAMPQHRAQFSVLEAHLAEDIARLPPERRTKLLADALEAAATDAAKIPKWGDMHRLHVRHLLAFIPLIGRFFTYADLPIGGSRETVMKAGHDLINRPSATEYGSQARHISDMSDPDANYFVLLGGNDGMLGSENALDQVDLWLKGQYLRMPLTPEAIVRDFPIVTTITA